MRWIFITLIVINGLYLGWELWSQNAGSTLAVNPGADTGDGQRLVLLSETSKLTKSGSVVGGEVTGDECFLVGPVSGLAKAEQLVAGLQAQGYKAAFEEAENVEAIQFWVLVPPADDKSEALRTLKSLQALKIDSYLLSSGEFVNAISLGVFNEERSARILRNKIMDEGFDAEIHRKTQTIRDYLVQIEPIQSFENTKKTVISLGFAEAPIKISDVACEKFALAR